MQKTASGYLHSPSDLITFMESPYASFMDRLHLEFPKRLSPDEPDEQAELVMRKGVEHEEAFLTSLVAGGRDVCRIDRGPDAREATREAIATQREIIYQAALAREGFAGYADFLVRDPASGLYEVWDTKLSRKARPYFLVQLCAYADMLEALQGRRPELVRVVLGAGEVRKFRTEDAFYYYLRLREAYLDQFAAFDPEQAPFPAPGANHGRWASHAEKLLEEVDHLCRVANIRQSQIKKLEASGISTLKALAATGVTRVPHLEDSIFLALKDQAALQCASAGRDRPDYRILDLDPEDPGRGLASLPPLSPLDVFFDMEGYPLVEGGLEYLFGASYREDGEITFKDWWAFDRDSEKLAFESFIDWVTERRRRDPTMHIYHYAPYEVSAVRRLMGRYATREDDVDSLLRGEVFVDLYRVVREGIRIGEPAYSIKNVEHLYLGRREGDVTNAGASIVAFENWIETGEPRDWRESPILKAIRDYNADDCESTLLLADWLRERQAEAEIHWLPQRRETEGQENEPVALPDSIVRRKALATNLLEEIPTDEEQRAADAGRWRVQEIMAQLLEFHRREAKPVWWEMFDRHAMTPEELWEDIHCLGGLTREPGGAVPLKRSRGYWYRFNPAQDTKIAAGDSVYFAHDLAIKATIEELDDDGRVLVKLGPKFLDLLNGAAPPESLCLIPDDFVSADTIAAAIDDIVTEYAETHRLSGCLESFLHRSPPRVNGHAWPLRLAPGEDPSEVAAQVVRALEDSTLCIQGPPGAGKTYTGSLMIAALLADGMAVGVTSNSHKAIHNLLRAVGNRQEGRLPAIKVGGDKDAEELQKQFPDLRCLGSTPAAEVFNGGLIGGTAWFFSRPEMAERLDYLFVDEAGQVSVANLVAMSRSAKNLVLLGDQMQLGQPTKGSHPGESGLSALAYLLQDHATIPDELGIFLAKTWRLHPDICEFISGAVYEGRLKPEQHTAERVVLLGDSAMQVPRASGLVFHPVQHDGNSQASDEEVEVIVSAAQELLGREWMHDSGEPRKLSLDDILFIAPYNMQVRRLREALPPGSRVGSIDKFQGQEAPVVIVSMCTSPGESGPRGLKFLLDRNRLNVAISRAKCLAVVVGDPRLAQTPCGTVEELVQLNLYCRILEAGRV
ncbi:MAG TPA: TM0106 family RecB-like putative nuclease [Phycisphaerae bacterium]|nr:TM0106 family RecB-like putative nuclease [Phycisphaerae bacterium]